MGAAELVLLGLAPSLGEGGVLSLLIVVELGRLGVGGEQLLGEVSFSLGVGHRATVAVRNVHLARILGLAYYASGILKTLSERVA